MRTSSVERGFTLVEILIALLLVVLISGSSFLLLSPARQGAALAAEARDLATWLERGRARALVQHTTVELTVVPVGPVASGLSEKMPRHPVSLEGGQPVRIAFHADGSARGGVVPLGIAGRRSVVTVDSITGRVRIEERVDAP
jgi:prepilin-type N-terminal cleavage/methylation domain-containing protein